MSRRLLVAFAATAATVLVSAQDADSPSTFRGKWQGNMEASFAQANPSVANSYECMPQGFTASMPHTLEIGQFDVKWGATKQWQQKRGSSTWTFPATAAKSFTWASYDSNIARLRTGPNTLECYWMMVDGKGKDRKLKVVTLGGAAYSWTDQCSSAAYQAIADVDSKPSCASASGSRSPLRSTVLATYDYKGGADLVGSGAGSAATLALAAGGALAVAVAAALAM